MLSCEPANGPGVVPASPAQQTDLKEPCPPKTAQVTSLVRLSIQTRCLRPHMLAVLAPTCWFSPWKSSFTSVHLWADVPLWGAHMLVFPMEITLYVPLPLDFLWAYVPLWGAQLVFPIEITVHVPAPRLAVYNINSQTERGEVRTEDLEGSSVVRGTRLLPGHTLLTCTPKQNTSWERPCCVSTTSMFGSRLRIPSTLSGSSKRTKRASHTHRYVRAVRLDGAQWASRCCVSFAGQLNCARHGIQCGWIQPNGRAGASSVSLGKESKCSYFAVVRSEATHSLKQDMILT